MTCLEILLALLVTCLFVTRLLLWCMAVLKRCPLDSAISSCMTGAVLPPVSVLDDAQKKVPRMSRQGGVPDVS